MRGLWVLPVLLAVSGPALADPRDEVLDRVARCGRIEDSHKWLDCFYGSAQPMRSYLNLSPAPPSQVALVPPSGPGPSQPLRAPAPPPPPGGPPPMPEHGSMFGGLFGDSRPVVAGLRMRAYDFDHGVFTVTLEDGQVWQQEARPRDFARWNKPAAGYVVTITPGALDSYDLRVKGIKAFYKVHRVR